MSGARDRQLDDESKKLLGALDEMRSLERQKRSTERSSAEYQALAEAVDRKANEVFRRASGELEDGPEETAQLADQEAADPGDGTRGSPG